MMDARVAPTVPLINNHMNLIAKLAMNGEADLEHGVMRVYMHTYTCIHTDTQG